jgi:hypothetical protein
MLKFDSLKTNCSKSVSQPFEPYDSYVIFVKYDMYLYLFIFIIWTKNADG